MNNREKINGQQQIRKALGMATRIQSAGIGTAFFYLNGHVNNAEVVLYIPSWFSDADPTHRFVIHGRPGHLEENQATLEKLKAILDAGPIENEAEVLLQQKEAIRIKKEEEMGALAH